MDTLVNTLCTHLPIFAGAKNSTRLCKHLSRIEKGNIIIKGYAGKALHWSSTLSELAEKLQTSEGWEMKIFNNIDWQSWSTLIKGVTDNNKNKYLK